MLRTIKGKLTVSMIGIVVASILLTTMGIITVAGRQTIQDQTRALQLNADMTEINGSMVSITELVGEIAELMQKMNQSAKDSNENSETVVKQMEELFRLSELLNQTVDSFRV